MKIISGPCSQRHFLLHGVGRPHLRPVPGLRLRGGGGAGEWGGGGQGDLRVLSGCWGEQGRGDQDRPGQTPAAEPGRGGGAGRPGRPGGGLQCGAVWPGQVWAARLSLWGRGDPCQPDQVARGIVNTGHYCFSKKLFSTIPRSRTPQLVMLTFDDSLNDLNRKLYESIFQVTRNIVNVLEKSKRLNFSLRSDGTPTGVPSPPHST